MIQWRTHPIIIDKWFIHLTEYYVNQSIFRHRSNSKIFQTKTYYAKKDCFATYASWRPFYWLTQHPGVSREALSNHAIHSTLRRLKVLLLNMETYWTSYFSSRIWIWWNYSTLWLWKSCLKQETASCMHHLIQWEDKMNTLWWRCVLWVGDSDSQQFSSQKYVSFLKTGFSVEEIPDLGDVVDYDHDKPQSTTSDDKINVIIISVNQPTNVCVLITAAIITAIYCHKKKQQQNSTEISTPLPPESLEDDPL